MTTAVIEGCDASRRVDGAAAAAAGLRFVLRYYGSTARTSRSWKWISAAEVADLHAHGIDIGALYEGGATQALGGRAQGVTDATEARAAWRSLGYPDQLPIWYAVDFDASPGQLATVGQYMAGIWSVDPNGGVYGGIRTIDYVARLRADAPPGFQTYAWSAGKWSTRAPLQQYHNGVQLAGGDLDRCRIVAPLTLWEPDMTTTAQDVVDTLCQPANAKKFLAALLATDGLIPNFTWKADAATNPQIKLVSALGEIGDEAHAANVAAAAALDAVKAIAIPAGGLTGDQLAAAIHTELAKLGVTLTVAP